MCCQGAVTGRGAVSTSLLCTCACAPASLTSVHVPTSLSAHVQPADKLRLFKDSTLLEAGRSLADQGVESGDTLAVVYQQEGAPRTQPRQGTFVGAFPTIHCRLGAGFARSLLCSGQQCGRVMCTAGPKGQ